MKKNYENLIKNFKKIEEELVCLLKETESIDFEAQKSVVKKDLKNYIKKVNKAKQLFSEYELIANKIANVDETDDDLSELSKTVLDLREMSESAVDNEIEITNKPTKRKKDETKSKNKEPVKNF